MYDQELHEPVIYCIRLYLKYGRENFQHYNQMFANILVGVPMQLMEILTANYS